MIVAIMQPYFFPYIGYFQLMKAVDLFVFYDDVQFIKRGWINRNRILVGGQPSWLTLPVRHDSQTISINRRNYLLNESVDIVKAKLRSAYALSPKFSEIYPFVNDLLSFTSTNIAQFNANLLAKTARRLDIKCQFAVSSAIVQPAGLRGEEKIINLCKTLGANRYINPIGGVELYDPLAFAAAGIRLSFLRSTAQPTSTESGPQHLSIIHDLMCSNFDCVKEQLNVYELIDARDLADA